MNIKDSPLFLRTTKKLYEEVNNRKDKSGSSTHYSHLDVVIEKNFFKDDEWGFLNKYEDKFKFPVQINEENYKLMNVYKIENDKLKTNPLNVWGIKNKFLE